MKKDIVYKLTKNFEDFQNETEEGTEFWLTQNGDSRNSNQKKQNL